MLVSSCLASEQHPAAESVSDGRGGHPPKAPARISMREANPTAFSRENSDTQASAYRVKSSPTFALDSCTLTLLTSVPIT